MDEFGFEQEELDGALVSLEFGLGGRIQRLWAIDPNLPEEGEELQFVLPPLGFGEEFSEDYYPGTLLIGARLGENDPWVVARNTEAEVLDSTPTSTVFRYDLSLLPEIYATGKFYEELTPLPHIVWDVEITNRGRVPIEIGELAFPMAFNNFYEGFAKPDKGGKSAWTDRFHIHKFIGGAGSHLFVQRCNAEPPGLLVVPGDGTSWEFFNHVPASLNSPYHWEGIPVVYVASKAAVEREGWNEWHNGHSSFTLAAGESRKFQTRFLPADRDKSDMVSQTMAALQRPAIRLLPAAVAPFDVGIAVEVGGISPTRFKPSRPAKLDTDSDEGGGFCFVKPAKPGPLHLEISDREGRTTQCHMLFIAPIEKLINKRADWIMDHQILRDPKSVFDQAILVADNRRGQMLATPSEEVGSFAVQGGLGDALYLAEKNAIYPDKSEIQALDRLIEQYVRDDLQNPGDGAVGTVIADSVSVATHYASPQAYVLVMALYHSMFRVAKGFGGTAREPHDYLDLAAKTAYAMLSQGTPRHLRSTALPGYQLAYELLTEIIIEQREEHVSKLMPLLSNRAGDLLRHTYPFAPPASPDWGGFAEAMTAARLMQDEEQQERALRCAMAARSLSASWWWYGADRRQLENDAEMALGTLQDRGDLCLGGTTAANSAMFLATLDRDYDQLPETYMRLAFGGLLGVWALVNQDGSASMGYGPDPASKSFGFHPLTGDIGFALYHYLREAGAYVLPNRSFGTATFGCHMETDHESYHVRPWDGVGRKVILRQIGAEFRSQNAIIRTVTLDSRKRWARLTLENPSNTEVWAELRVKGLWGSHFEVSGRRVGSTEGEMAVSVQLKPRELTLVDIKVVG